MKAEFFKEKDDQKFRGKVESFVHNTSFQFCGYVSTPYPISLQTARSHTKYICIICYNFLILIFRININGVIFKYLWNLGEMLPEGIYMPQKQNINLETFK